MSSQTHAQVFRRTAKLTLIIGLLVAAIGLLAGAIAGGTALTGAAWGSGGGAAIALLSAAVLAFPWERYPLNAGAGVMLTFFVQMLVLVTVLFLLSRREGSYSPGWFFATFAICVLTVVGVQVGSLLRSRALTVQVAQDAS